MTKRHIQLGDVLEVIADAIPNEPALITNEVYFTYAQLDERVTRLANHLRSIGIRRGEHVGVHAQNCHEWVEAFYACAKISAVPVNVNYRYVEAELLPVRQRRLRGGDRGARVRGRGERRS